jgi:hypothetical protein
VVAPPRARSRWPPCWPDPPRLRHSAAPARRSAPAVAWAGDHRICLLTGTALEATSNIVDQYVLYLRRKIERPFGVRQLETVRGAGYRLRRASEPAEEQPTRDV